MIDAISGSKQHGAKQSVPLVICSKLI